MICANCHEPSAPNLCPACGQQPMLQGRYRLDAVVGRGAAGTTFRATRRTDGLVVAIKELDYRKLESFKTEELFERESRVLRQLDHPGIPSYVDAFSVESGRHIALYLVQEFIDGPTLAQEGLERRYDEEEILDVLEELAEILAYLHSRTPPVIHRDIKPRNAMRRGGSAGGDGRLVLIDFGSVRDVIDDQQQGGSTIAGTVGFMAPEQLAGIAMPASDVYGLGALAICMLSGKEPHQMLDARHRLDWRPHVEVSGPVARLLEGMLELDHEERPRDGGALLRAIERARHLPEVVPPAVNPAPPNPAGISRKRAALAVLAAIGFAICVGLASGSDDGGAGEPIGIEGSSSNAPSIPTEPLGQLSYVVHRMMTLEQAREKVPGLKATTEDHVYTARLVVARLPMECELSFEEKGGAPYLNGIHCIGEAQREGMTSVAGMRKFLRAKYGRPAVSTSTELRWYDERDAMTFQSTDRAELHIGGASMAR